MNIEDLEISFKRNKRLLIRYVDAIKKDMEVDIYSVINATLIKNPYNTDFPIKYFLGKADVGSKLFIFFKSSAKFYINKLFDLIMYAISFIVFRVYSNKRSFDEGHLVGIDVFFLVDKVVDDRKLNESYFDGLYDVLEKRDSKYVFLPRIYGASRRPLKLVKFFKILNQEKRCILFEHDLLSIKDFISLLFMIVAYPFKSLRLLQKEASKQDKIFNKELIRDIGALEFNAFSRYIFGKNISKLSNINIIYSWSEFQVIERSFNYGVRTNNKDIILFGCQFIINADAYFHTRVDDVDFIHNTSFHEVLVNGKMYVLNRKYIKYRKGVSLRYSDVFSYNPTFSGDNILLLGASIISDTKYMIKSVSSFDYVLLKKHPAVNIDDYGALGDNIYIVTEDIYQLFSDASIVIGTASGACLEAVASGVPVIIMASRHNITANPLSEYGKGKIWDIAFNRNDVDKIYNALIDYRKNNISEIEEISSWYRDNYFIEPIEDRIIKLWGL